MRAPRFWDNPPERPGALARLLAPAAWLWAAATRRRIASGPGEAPGAPVICVGNLTVGGTGKTPAAIALLERLSARGVAAQVVTRGYGGSLAGPVRVDPARHSAAQVGDEPLLLAAFAPVWVGRDRAAAARRAVADGAQAIVMDDGFQNPGLAKDFSIVVIDARTGFGNGRVMPAGPLREPVAEGLARAGLVLLVGGAKDRAAREAALPPGGPPVAGGALEPLRTGMDWTGLRAIAFAGIGRPEKFFATLADLGAEILAAHALADHAALDPRLLARLEREAKVQGAQLVTTEKDAARLPAAFRTRCLVLPVRLVLDDWIAIDAGLARLGL